MCVASWTLQKDLVFLQRPQSSYVCMLSDARPHAYWFACRKLWWKLWKPLDAQATTPCLLGDKSWRFCQSLIRGCVHQPSCNSPAEIVIECSWAAACVQRSHSIDLSIMQPPVVSLLLAWSIASSCLTLLWVLKAVQIGMLLVQQDMPLFSSPQIITNMICMWLLVSMWCWWRRSRWHAAYTNGMLMCNGSRLIIIQCMQENREAVWPLTSCGKALLLASSCSCRGSLAAHKVSWNTACK